MLLTCQLVSWQACRPTRESEEVKKSSVSFLLHDCITEPALEQIPIEKQQ